MGIFFNQQGQALYDGQLHNLQVTESVYGTTGPIVIGTARVHGKLLFYGGFYHTQAPNTGKGLFSGKSNVYVYWADCLILLAGSPCIDVLNIWQQNGMLVNQSQAYTYTIPTGGGTISPITGNTAPIQQDLGVSKSVAYSFQVNDYGSGGVSTLSGTQQVPLQKVTGTPSAGQYSFDAATSSYTFAAADAGAQVSISYTGQFSLYYLQTTEAHVIPAGAPYTISPDNQNYFYNDEGVVYMETGAVLTKVSGSPAQGQYNLSGSYATGVIYTFNSADAGQVVYITYEYITSDSTVTNTSSLNFTFFNGTLSQAPWSYMTSKYPGDAFGYSGKCYIGANPLFLGEAGSMPAFNYELMGIGIFGGGNRDAHPCDGMNYVLADTINGCGFPTANLDSWANGKQSLEITGATNAAPIVFTVAQNPITAGFRVGQTVGCGGSTPTSYNGLYIITALTSSTVTVNNLIAPGTPWSSGGLLANSCYAYWAANNYLVSKSIDTQSSITSTLKPIIETGNVAAVWSSGLLKLIPYGDSTAIGNGFIYTPTTTPVATLTIDDLLPSGDSRPGSKLKEDPVQVTVKAPQDCLNYVQCNWTDRQNQYNLNLISEQNDAFIAQYGFRPEQPQTWDFITSLTTATWALGLRLKRQCYIRNNYKFFLSYRFVYLEPMDMVVLPTGEAVRVTEVEDASDGKLTIQAEQWTYGVSSVSLYAKQQATSYQPTQSQALPGNAIPVVVQKTATQTGGATNQILISAIGQSANWGGANVYVSVDGVEYSTLGLVKSAGIIGQLTATLPSNSDPDTTDTLAVNLTLSSASNSQAQLSTVTKAQADAFASLCAIVDANGVSSELISYQTATLTQTGFYNLTYLRRGVYGTTVAPHSSGAWFAYLGSNPDFLTYTFPPNFVGTTIYLKLQSFNLMQNQTQPLSQCPVYAITVSNQGVTVVEVVVPSASTTVTAGSGGSVQNPSYAYDKNFATNAIISAGPAASAGGITVTYSGFGTGITTVPVTMYVQYSQLYTMQVDANDYSNITIQYGLNGTANVPVFQAGQGVSSQPASSGRVAISVPSGTNLANLVVAIEATQTNTGAGGITSSVDIAEIWLDGTGNPATPSPAYTTLTDGTVMTWGTTSVINGPHLVSYPIPLPNGVESTVATTYGGTDRITYEYSYNNTSFGVNNNGSGVQAAWLALGSPTGTTTFTDGTVMQWGISSSFPGLGSYGITFPTAMGTSTPCVLAGVLSSTDTLCWIESISSTGFTVAVNNPGQVFWIAFSTASGAESLPNGNSLQWGTTATISGSTSVTFSPALATALLAAIACTYSTTDRITYVSAGSLTGITISNNGSGAQAFWAAVGY